MWRGAVVFWLLPAVSGVGSFAEVWDVLDGHSSPPTFISGCGDTPVDESAVGDDTWGNGANSSGVCLYAHEKGHVVLLAVELGGGGKLISTAPDA